MRILAVPLSRSRWLFHSVMRHGAENDLSAAVPKLSSAEAFSSLRNAARLSGVSRQQAIAALRYRALQTVQSKARDAAEELTASMATAAPTSVKGRLHSVWLKLKSRVDSREDLWLDLNRFERRIAARNEHRQFLSAAAATAAATAAAAGAPASRFVGAATAVTPTAAAAASGAATGATEADAEEAAAVAAEVEDDVLHGIELIYPQRYSADAVVRELSAFQRARASAHRRLQHLSVACLPVSLLAGALPGPNVFIVWNAYRLMAHVNAQKGMSVFDRYRAAAPPRVTYTASAVLDQLLPPHLAPLSAADASAAGAAAAAGAGAGTESAASGSAGDVEVVTEADIVRIAEQLHAPALLDHFKRMKRH